jgi:hypothetical protein
MIFVVSMVLSEFRSLKRAGDAAAPMRAAQQPCGPISCRGKAESPVGYLRPLRRCARTADSPGDSLRPLSRKGARPTQQAAHDSEMRKIASPMLTALGATRSTSDNHKERRGRSSALSAFFAVKPDRRRRAQRSRPTFSLRLRSFSLCPHPPLDGLCSGSKFPSVRCAVARELPKLPLRYQCPSVCSAVRQNGSTTPYSPVRLNDCVVQLRRRRLALPIHHGLCTGGRDVSPKRPFAQSGGKHRVDSKLMVADGSESRPYLDPAGIAVLANSATEAESDTKRLARFATRGSAFPSTTGRPARCRSTRYTLLTPRYCAAAACRRGAGS